VVGSVTSVELSVRPGVIQVRHCFVTSTITHPPTVQAAGLGHECRPRAVLASRMLWARCQSPDPDQRRLNKSEDSDVAGLT
jgi:hypothetical protein